MIPASMFGKTPHGSGEHASKLNHIIAIDGEGYYDKRTGLHTYVMLCASDGRINGIRRKVENPNGLTLRECAEFLFSLPNNALKIGFSISYDVNMMTGELPLEKVNEMYGEKGRTSYHGVSLVWYPGKMFSIGSHRRRKATRKKGTSTIVRKVCYDQHCTVWDIFGYFQKTFAASLQEWDIGTVEVQNEIIRMKARRSEFTDNERSAMAEYCFNECDLLVEMFAKLLRQVHSLGIPLARYDGSGSIAAGLDRKYGVAKFIAVPPKAVHEAALQAYFGGRFETGVIGYVGDAHSYDINSAYPAITQDLPCLRCGMWDSSTELHKHGVYHIKWDIQHGRKLERWGPFPFRSMQGGIVYPHAGEGWYWGAEIIAAIRMYGEDITVIEGHRYTTKCSHQPFSFVPELYEKRQKLKAVGDFGHIVIKLGLNSLYGKCAQSIGGKRNKDGTFQRPTYQSFIWAGMITSGTRAIIIDAIAASHPDNVLSIATDGIFTKTKIDKLCIGTGLGEWTYKEIHDLSLVQNGVYRYRVGDEWMQRARGFPGRDFDFDRLLSELELGGENVSVTTHVELSATCMSCQRLERPCATPRFIGARAALQRNPKLTNWRQWVSIAKTIRLRPPNRLLDSYFGGDQTIRPIPTYAWLKMGYLSIAYQPHVNFSDLYQRQEDDVDLPMVETAVSYTTPL